jgi:hypothetical protein
MRAAGILLLLVASLVFGCKNKDDADAAPDPAAVKAQQDLIARRDALLAMRTKLQGEKDSVEAQIKDAESKGGDTADLVKKKADLESQIESSTSDLISIASSKLDASRQTLDKSASLAAREAEMSTRERLVAEREARIADREKGLIQRDAELAARWKDTCTGGGTTIIQQAPIPKGGNLSKKEVSDLISRGKAGMNKKGLVGSDLPGYAQGLEADALKALNADNDTYKASIAATGFVQAVDQVVVNKKFISDKMNRLNAAIKAKGKMDDAAQQQLGAINNEVSKLVIDGDYISASRRLNTAAGLLDR